VVEGVVDALLDGLDAVAERLPVELLRDLTVAERFEATAEVDRATETEFRLGEGARPRQREVAEGPLVARQLAEDGVRLAGIGERLRRPHVREPVVFLRGPGDRPSVGGEIVDAQRLLDVGGLREGIGVEPDLDRDGAAPVLADVDGDVRANATRTAQQDDGGHERRQTESSQIVMSF
jgi:hypothetical protein